jgi:hypothetical protein
MPVKLANQEAEISNITVQSQPGQILHKTLSQKYPTQNKILSIAGKWMELMKIILSEVRLRRPKIACFPSSEDYRPKTNAVILLNMGHTLRRERTQEE